MMPVNQIICGSALEVMKGWPNNSINCCVTSPPYWGLRDYGVDGQLGLEKTPEEYVAKMVEIFAEVKRVLKPEGTLWMNLGDSYNGSGGDHKAGKKNDASFQGEYSVKCGGKGRSVANLKPKDLCGIPWRVAFALQKDGWWLRQDIIWAKPNPMPESVTDRCTKAHEYIFLITKKPRYYYDADAIREPATYAGKSRGGSTNRYEQNNAGMDNKVFNTKNKRSVWTVNPCAYKEAHFATFPPKLIEPCILAGCPEFVCKKCGKARVRVVEKKPATMNIRIRDAKKGILDKKSGGKATVEEIKNYGQEEMGESKTTGWTDCGCNAGWRYGIVLDPFMGAATTALVAYKNNRDYIGIELNPEYVKMADARLAKAKNEFALFEANR